MKKVSCIQCFDKLLLDGSCKIVRERSTFLISLNLDIICILEFSNLPTMPCMSSVVLWFHTHVLLFWLPIFLTLPYMCLFFQRPLLSLYLTFLGTGLLVSLMRKECYSLVLLVLSISLFSLYLIKRMHCCLGLASLFG